MRTALALALLVGLAAGPAAADRAANFSAQLAGADADTAGVVVNHDAKGWSMKVRAKPGAAQKTIKVAAPATHGDYLVLVEPGRKHIAWVLVGDVNGVPADTDPVAWIYQTSTGALAKQVTWVDLFTQADRDAVPMSTAGASWLQDKPLWKAAKVTLPMHRGQPMIVDLSAATAKRVH